jgi:hypothetical protein
MKLKVIEQVMITRLGHDGCENYLPQMRLHNKWKIGQKVRVIVEPLKKRKK